MKREQMEEKVNRAFAHAAPDIRDAVLADCNKQKGTILPMEETKQTKSGMKKWIAAAAALVLLAAGGLTAARLYGANAVESTVSLDVNPSIEIQVNQKEEVLAVNAKNEDARIVVGEMDFKGSSLDVTVNALIGSMLRNGYLNELANSILVSVDSDDPAKAAALQSRLSEEINALLQTDSFSGSVLSQTLSHDAELQKMADEYGITLGKAQRIQQITQKNSLYTFASLVPLSINELNLLIASNDVQLDNVQSTGTASDKAYIGVDKAKAAALAHAGLQQADVTFGKVKLDYDDGRAEYEVEFYRGHTEYDYDIDATTGEVLSFDQETEGNRPQQTQRPAATATPAPVKTPAAAESISADKAKSIALSHAGVAAADARQIKCELDRDDGMMVYEVEFKAGGYEYDYEINAVTGTILKSEKDWDD